MTGREEKEQVIVNKINTIIDNNSDKFYLRGFFYYLDSMSILSVKSYIEYVVNFMNSTHKTPTELTIDDYTAYMFSLRTKTSSYRIAVYSALKKFSSYLASNGTNSKNPMLYVKRPKAIETQETKAKREKGFLTTEEIQTYLSNVENSIRHGNKKNLVNPAWIARDYFMVLLFLNTGMRCSALAQINVEDIDVNKKQVIVYEKEDKIITYFLNDKLITIMNDWMNYRSAMNLNTNAMFVSNQGRRMSEANIYRLINKYGDNIEGKKLSPHKLRATYGTQLYNATKDIVFVQKAMNHSNSHTTELYIRGKGDESKKQAADIMSKLTFS